MQMLSIEQIAELKGASFTVRAVKRFELVATKEDGTDIIVSTGEKKSDFKNVVEFLASVCDGDAKA